VPLVLLDLDGTLADPGGGITAAMAHALGAMGAPTPDEEALRRWVGPPLSHAFAALLPDPTPDAVSRAVALYRARFERVGLAAARAYPGITDLLGAMTERGWTLWVVTFKSRQHAVSVTERLGIAPHLAGVTGASPEGPSDKPALIASILAREGVDPADAVVVGDRRHDVEGARANGAAALGVTWGFGSKSELERAGTDWLCDAPDEGLRILDAWFAGPLPSSRAEILHWRRLPRERPARIETPGAAAESCWSYPRPPRLAEEARPLRIEHAGNTLADTRRALRVLETASPPTYYIPRSDVADALLEPDASRSLCEWKGAARYWRLRGAPDALPVAWSYPAPFPGFEALQDHLAFFASRVHACYVGDERARPQPGGFYGGWITDDVTGPFKGMPGSERW